MPALIQMIFTDAPNKNAPTFRRGIRRPVYPFGHRTFHSSESKGPGPHTLARIANKKVQPLDYTHLSVYNVCGGFMAAKRMNITLPEDVVKILKKKTKPGEMSAYIAKAVRHLEKRQSTQQLVRELIDAYSARAQEESPNEWDVTLSDGLADED